MNAKDIQQTLEWKEKLRIRGLVTYGIWILIILCTYAMTGSVVGYPGCLFALVLGWASAELGVSKGYDKTNCWIAGTIFPLIFIIWWFLATDRMPVNHSISEVQWENVSGKDSAEFREWISHLDEFLIPLGKTHRNYTRESLWNGYKTDMDFGDYYAGGWKQTLGIAESPKIVNKKPIVPSETTPAPDDTIESWMGAVDDYLRSIESATRSNHFHPEALEYGWRKGLEPKDFIAKGYNKRLSDL